MNLNKKINLSLPRVLLEVPRIFWPYFLLIARLVIRVLRMAANSLLMRSRWRWLMGLCTLGLSCVSWNEISNSVRSGDLGDHSCSWPCATIRSLKSSLSRARSAGAPCMLHQIEFKFVVVAFTIHNFNSQVHFIYARLIKNLLKFKADNVTKFLANYAKLGRVRILALLWVAVKISQKLGDSTYMITTINKLR